MDSITGLMDLGAAPLIAMLTMAITQAFKSTKYLPRETMPLVSLLVGAIGYVALEGATGKNIILGIIIGFAATGGHQFLKQSFRGLAGETTTQ